MKPVNRSIYGIPDTDGPFTGSGLVELSFGLPESPKTNTPPTGAMYPDSDDPHDKVRVLDAAYHYCGKLRLLRFAHRCAVAVALAFVSPGRAPDPTALRAV